MWTDDFSRHNPPISPRLWTRTSPSSTRVWGLAPRCERTATDEPSPEAVHEGSAAATIAPVSPTAQRAAAPVAQAPTSDLEHTTPHLRFALQQLVAANGRVAGHELLFRWNSADAPVHPALGAYATACALSHSLIDGQLLTQDPPAQQVGTLYVNMDERSLLGPMVEVVTPDLGVIELLETVTPTAAVQRRLQALHSRGYRFSLDDVESTDDPRWVLAEYVESVKIDVRATAPDQIRPIIALARTAGLTVVAEKVETQAQIAELAAMGAQLFQGYGVQRPVVKQVPALPGCRSGVLGVLHQMMAAGAGPEALSMVAHNDPALVARLLRLQALHAPRDVAMSEDLAQVLASLPRPVLGGWVTHWLIAAQHVRGQDAVARVSRELARYRRALMADGPLHGPERRVRLFSRYRELVETL